METAALYIHIPWCVRKCPYCDFNSHQIPNTPKEGLPESVYLQALLWDFDNDIRCYGKRNISSVFIGGGTPSVMSPAFYKTLLAEIFNRVTKCTPDIEITMEANPGTVDAERFAGFRDAGINRLSLGVQSFDDQKLQVLGRIHGALDAKNAFLQARSAGFDNINIDIMHGLPKQTSNEALADLTQTIALEPAHISWYQLTLEPNTVFYKQRPPLPQENDLETIEQEGFAYLAQQGYQRYEISAFCKNGRQSTHNRNYWQFGDYYGIGAGAHGKLREPSKQQMVRMQKTRLPKDYLRQFGNLAQTPKVHEHTLTESDIVFEYMLNLSRLEEPIAKQHFEIQTGLPFALLEPKLLEASQRDLLRIDDQYFHITPLGRRFTNDLQALFLV